MKHNIVLFNPFGNKDEINSLGENNFRGMMVAETILEWIKASLGITEAGRERKWGIRIFSDEKHFAN